ncbi:MAG TPA: hypothetical protein VFX59_30705 [Polyangiales bacterium]|nr:hypothetical protein [Polyangiales bacterium]
MPVEAVPYKNPEPLPAPSLSADTTPNEQDTPQPAPPAAQPPPGGNTFAGFLDFNVYPYLANDKSDSIFSINMLAILPRGFSYFGFVNFNGDPKRNPFMDSGGFYSEHTLNYTFWDKLPIDALIQYNPRTGPANDRFRVGVRLRVDAVPYLGDLLKKIYVSYGVNFHFYQLDHQTDRYVTQIEQFGRMDFPYLDNRLYISAFGDRTFNEGLQKALGLRRKNPLVSEIQAGVRLYDQLYFIYEFRILEYRAADVLNHAIGGEYVAKW